VGHKQLEQTDCLFSKTTFAKVPRYAALPVVSTALGASCWFLEFLAFRWFGMVDMDTTVTWPGWNERHSINRYASDLIYCFI